eukprot:TRINITY_DN2104_c0_g3_i3.p1 TRINITY_DN2104_c0_g3~~TRINITY_DN2104_c0_g3_i3.p1  ORF type:complete len:184 (-),score=7.79 TRINITY_DN2104_c0_g3_i3:701-1177(-)
METFRWCSEVGNDLQSPPREYMTPLDLWIRRWAGRIIAKFLRRLRSKRMLEATKVLRHAHKAVRALPPTPDCVSSSAATVMFVRLRGLPRGSATKLTATVFVGDRPCMDVAWHNTDTIRCTTPPGHGQRMPVSISLCIQAPPLGSRVTLLPNPSPFSV